MSQKDSMASLTDSIKAFMPEPEPDQDEHQEPDALQDAGLTQRPEDMSEKDETPRTYVGRHLSQMRKSANEKLQEAMNRNEALEQTVAQLRAELEQSNRVSDPQSAGVALRDGETLEEGVLCRIDPETVVHTRWRNRVDLAFSDEPFDELCESLGVTNGNEVPAKVRRIPLDDPRTKEGIWYEVIYGHRRHMACLREGLPYLAIIVDDIDDQRLVQQMMLENNERESLSDYEEAVQYQRWIDTGVCANLAQVSKLVGVHRSTVTRRMKLLELPDEVLSCFPDPRVLTERWARQMLETAESEEHLAKTAARVREQRDPERTDAKVMVKAIVRALEYGSDACSSAREPLRVIKSGKQTLFSVYRSSKGYEFKIDPRMPESDVERLSDEIEQIIRSQVED